MTVITASIQDEVVNISDSLIEQLEFWLKATDGVGRFTVKLDNSENAWIDIIAPDDSIQIKCDGITVFEGYIDKGYPEAKENHLMTFEVVGRDYGQDLQNKLVNKSGAWMYEKQPADDIIDAMLSQAASEITYVSPGTAPEIMYTDQGDEYLIEAIRKIAERVKYDFFIDESKAFHFFPIGTVVSGIELDATAESESANIVGPIKTTKFDSFEIRNYIIAKGSYVNDGWSEGNAADFAGIAGNVVSDDYVNVYDPLLSVASIKCTKGEGTHPELSLTFPKFNYDHLPFTFPYSEMVFHLYLESSRNYPSVGVLLEDTEGSIIEFWFQRLAPYTKQKEVWHQYTVPVGTDLTDEIRTWTNNGQNNWEYLDAASEALGFNWQIVKITWLALHWETSIRLDGLCVPVPMVAYAEDAESQGFYKTRNISLIARDLKTQSELQAFADNELEKRMNPIGSIKLTAMGSVGLIGEANCWRQGYTVRVTSPDDDLDYVLLRMAEIHHVITDNPEHGHDWIVELTLVPYDAAISGSRLSQIETPEVALFRELNDKIRFLEKSAEVGAGWYPPMPGMPTSAKLGSLILHISSHLLTSKNHETVQEAIDYLA